MGTVKYSGPVASFHCPTEATIRSLKVHFSPKQLGEGTPSPENIRPIEGWDGVTVHNDKDGIVIPEEYQKVEYLESTGTQYIYTNIPIQSPFTIDADFLYTSESGDQCLICAGYNVDNRNIRVGALGYYSGNLQNYYSGFWYPGKIVVNTRYKAHVYLAEGSQITIINGIEINRNNRQHNSADIPLDKTKGNFGIFCMYRNNTPVYFCKAKIYSMKLWGETGTLVSNFIPCRRKSDDKPGMYDTVSGEFFTNQGTGEFICGPDVGETTEYEFGVLGKNKFPSADGTKSDVFMAKGITYTISATSSSSGYFKGYYKDGTDTGIVWVNEGSDGDRRWKRYTPREDIVSGFFYVTQGMSECQLELGSTATAYEPYNPNKTVYGGWVDLISGEVCEEYGLFAPDENSYITVISGNTYKQFRFQTAPAILNRNNGFCTHFTMTANPNVYGRTGMDWLNLACQLILQEDSSVYMTTVDELKSWLATQRENGTPFQIVYQAATPNTYYLAPTQLQTFLGQNNVWSNADYVEVEYDLHETQTILARKQFIIANQPHIVKPAAAPLQNFVTDMVAPLKECKVHFSPVQEGEGDPSPENVRAISGWNSIQIGLPSEYQRVEWIKNPEAITAYIDTGLFVTEDLRFIIEFQLDTSATKVGYFMGQYSGTSFYLYVGRNLCFQTAFGITWKDTTMRTDNMRHKFDYQFADGVLHITDENNAEILTGTFSAPSDKTICIGGPVHSNLVVHSTKTFSSKIWQNGVLIRNFVPCYRKADSKPGMYDTVTQTFFTNQGSGEFICGPDVEEQNLLVDWTSEAGTIYGGYVDLVTGKVWKDWDYYTIDGSQNIGCDGGYMFYMSSPWLNNLGCVNSYDYTGLIMANNFQTITHHNNLNSYNGEYLITGYGSNSGGNWIYFKLSNDISGTDNTSTVKSYFSEHPLTVYFKLKTPTLITTLTLTQLKSLRGTNNIWASNGGDNIEIAYWKH